MTMDADVAHCLAGARTCSGPGPRADARARAGAKLLRLLPVVRPAFARYRRLLEEAGRPDLAGVG